MAKAPTMAMIMAFVLSLLALPAFGVRPAGLERISFSSGLIEDECDKELRSLEKNFTETCERHTTKVNCHTEAKNTIKHSALYTWQNHLASKVLDDDKTPVFWAGFWPGGKKGIDTREALANFIFSVKGFQLADTEWGQAAESKGANNLENCAWDRKKNWWNVASINMAQAMALHNVPKIMIALHKTLHGKYPFYNTVLYRAELVAMGSAMRRKSTWNPKFEVRSIAVEGAGSHESGCALASAAKFQLEFYAGRPVTVWCRTCTTLQACKPKQLVEKKSPKVECIKGNCQNGQGTKTWADGEIYEGQWKNNKRDGQGTHTYAHGSKYQGQWKNGNQEGQGTFTWANGDEYQGEYKNGKRDGQGTETWADGSKYQGQWKNGSRDGQGTLSWADGQMYQGAWKNGLKDGQGTETWADGQMYHGQMYQGAWKNNKKDGQGTFTWANGDQYQGQWKNRLRQGQGTMTWTNGDQYQGEWKNSLQDGQGTETWDGTKYKVWYKEGHLTKYSPFD